MPSHAANGSSSCRRSLSGATSTATDEPSAGGADEARLAGVEPGVGELLAGGRVEPHLLAGVVASRVSVRGSKSSVPASASAMTVSGLVTNASVLALPSLRFGKLRL